MKLTRLAEQGNEAGFDVLAQNDWPEIVSGEDTLTILMDGGYCIVMSPVDALGLAQMARLALMYPDSVPSKADSGGRLPAHKWQPPTSA